MIEREFAIEVVRHLREAGFQALWAGGCVRDELLGLAPDDYDVATNARPEQVQRLFHRSIAVGASFGVIEVIGPRNEAGFVTVEVATFRSDVSYSDGRHPDAVVFSSAKEDALRRDFTINGMFFDPLSGELIDYVGGKADLEARLVRAIGDPAVRFAEDKLRMLRAVRIATRFDFALDRATADAIRAMAGQIATISAERIAEELRKLLVSPHRARGVRLLDETGLAKVLVPEAISMKAVPQGLPSAPTGDLWDHVLTVLDKLGPEASFPLAFAALLHDVGKPRTLARTPDRYTFHQHEHVGRRLASEIALRLKLSNSERERIEWLVEKHQYLSDARRMRPSKLKQILAHPGILELLALHRADALASGHSTDHVDYCEQLLQEWSEADLNPPPLLTGHDLLRLGIPRGPLFKKLLDAVREAQLDGTIAAPQQAMDMAVRIAQEESSN
ncbi:MAG: CCA tRNA nucleotidyltransferase [Gemmataceae bacterium]